MCAGAKVLARRNICKLQSWYLNKGEENEPKNKLLDGLLGIILLPPAQTDFCVFLHPDKMD